MFCIWVLESENNERVGMSREWYLDAGRFVLIPLKSKIDFSVSLPVDISASLLLIYMIQFSR